MVEGLRNMGFCRLGYEGIMANLRAHSNNHLSVTFQHSILGHPNPHISGPYYSHMLVIGSLLSGLG